MFNGAVPAFALDAGTAIVALRAASVLGLIVAFGAPLFALAVAPGAGRITSRLTGAGAAFAVLALLGWGWRQAALFTDAPSAAAALAALPGVLGGTRFGTVLLLQLGAVAGALLLRRQAMPACLCAGAALMLQAGHSHALSMTEGLSPLVLSDALHLLAAGAWLGGLLPLLALVWQGPAGEARQAAERFAPLGTIAVAALAGTALIQGPEMLGSWPALAGTAYGWAILGKIALFCTLLGFAALNRFRLVPSFARTERRAPLARSIAAESAAGIVIVALAGLLASLPPGMHTQPVWPFTVQPSLAAIREAPEIAREVTEAAAALALAAVLMVVAWVLSRRKLPRLAAAVVALGACVVAMPHLAPLLVPAGPMSFETSETGFAATAIARGRTLFAANCAVCHGAEGRGDGPAAAGLADPPADLTADHLWEHADGEMAGWLAQGIEAPDGTQAMPGFAGVLSPEERWSLIDYVRANNAGINRAATGRWPRAVRAPGFDMQCGARTMPLDAFAGFAVIVLLGDVALPPLPARTVAVRMGPGGEAACRSADPAVAEAYRIAAGLGPGEAAAVLVDGAGWLRLVAPGGWPDAQALAAAVREVRRRPVGAAARGGHHHH